MSEPQAVFSKTNSFASFHLHDIDPSWIDTLPNGELINKLRGSSRISPSILDSINSNLNLNIVDLRKSKGFANKIHFYTPEELQELVLKAGVINFSKKLKLIINGRDVRQYRQSLGDELYDFAIKNTLVLKNDPRAHKGELMVNDNIHKNSIALGYHSLQIAMKNVPNNCVYKLPLSWQKIHNTAFKPRHIEPNEKLFHINLIKALVENDPSTQSSALN